MTRLSTISGFVALTILCAVSMFAAAPRTLNFVAGTQAERNRFSHLEHTLNYTKEPMVGWWRIVIVAPGDWQDATRYYGVDGVTNTAFTLLGAETTFINGAYLDRGSDALVRHTIAHGPPVESSHIA